MRYEKSKFPEGETIRFLIIAFGNVPAYVLEYLTVLLKDIFRVFEVRVMDKQPIPEAAYDPRRDQYKSVIFLEKLSETRIGEKVLGVTEVDLFAPRLNFVFGEAQCPGRVAIISLHRLRQEFYGISKDEKRFLTRTGKEAIHELGHTYGLTHCHNPECVMFFSNSIWDTDRKGLKFCAKCSSEIELKSQQ